jgi:alkanesulfonate monooxygenase SsuD/methylene tetrahydromethanopterin reductase-like flavin-dependent oxidoreductase (luciferase family)
MAQLREPDLGELVQVAREAEEAGAAWLGVPDTFWGWDTWMTLVELARVTVSLEIGPVVTNPYLRHPFHTVAAVATLQRLAGPRVFVGLGAGGSELRAAGVDRTDAPGRVEHVAGLLRTVAAGGPLDPSSGRRLDVPVGEVPVLVAGRGPGMLLAAGRVADRALLWGLPASELAAGAGTVATGAAQTGRSPLVVWAPLVDDHVGRFSSGVPGDPAGARSVAAYAAVNSRPDTRQIWGLTRAETARLRARIVAEGPAAAAALLPAAALDDLILRDTEPARVASIARRIGAGAIAVPVFDTTTVAERVAWAHAVTGHLTSSTSRNDR